MTTTRYLGGGDPAVDHLGHMQGHSQSEHGSMHYWLMSFPWGTVSQTDRTYGQPSLFYLHLLSENDALAIISMPRHVTKNCPWLHTILQRSPKHCRGYDKEDYHWGCPS
eukprot:569142-Pyramimonas_sp.AAC.1